MPKKKQDYDITTIDSIVQLVPEDRRSIAENLALEVKFIYRTMERLRAEVDKGEIVEQFVQGAQQFPRENQALKQYTALLPKYAAIYKQIVDMLPPPVLKKAEPDELQQFMNGGADLPA